MTRFRALLFAAPLALIWALPVAAEGPEGDDGSWECQSCTARHQSLQALQQSRRTRNQENCVPEEAEGAGVGHCPEPPTEAPDSTPGLLPPASE